MSADEIDARVKAFATDAYDRDVVRAMLTQARQRGGITDVQMAHLLSIGFRSGYREGLADARPEPAHPRRRWWKRWLR